VGFAEPAGGKLGDVEGSEAGGVLSGEGVDDGSGLVGGAVVDGDDAEVVVVLLEERGEAGGDVVGFVAGGDDDCYRGGAGWDGVEAGFEEVGCGRGRR
jgi:hypothetical protein